MASLGEEAEAVEAEAVTRAGGDRNGATRVKHETEAIRVGPWPVDCERKVFLFRAIQVRCQNFDLNPSTLPAFSALPWLIPPSPLPNM